MGLEQQNVAVVRRQVLLRRVSASHVRAQLEAGRWRALTREVVVQHNGPLTGGQRWRAAVLVASSKGMPAGLAAWTSLEHLGLKRWERHETHLFVPRGRAVPMCPLLSVDVHQSRRFAGSDLVRVGGIATTRAARSAVDAAAWSPDARSACGVLAAVVQQRLATADELRRELVLAGSVRRVALVRKVVEDIADGAQAVSELDFLAFCRRHGFPRPTLQRRRDAGGRRFFLDATFALAGGIVKRVEIDGAPHLRAEAQWSDDMRLNALVIAGEQVLRLPSWVVYADDPVAVAQVRALIAD